MNGFNSYAAGTKRYGAAGGSAPNVGPSDPTGYRERDARLSARRNAVMNRLKQGQAQGIARPPMANVMAGRRIP